MRLKKDNIERIAESVDAIAKLKAAGYKEVKPVLMAVHEAEKAVDISEMDTTHLRALAKEKGLSGYSALTQAELLDTLKDVV